MNEPASDMIYGIHPCEEMLSRNPNRIHRVYFSQTRGDRKAFELLRRCRSRRIPYQVVPTRRLSELAGSAKHQGVVVHCSPKPYADFEELMRRFERSQPLFVLAASLEDPRNLGALIRSAVAFGASALLVERKHSVALNATVAKASAGMLEHMPVARPRSLEAALAGCREKGYSVVGALPGAAKRPHEIDFRRPTVLIVGGEHRGIPRYLRALCTDVVGIPTTARVGSLNVSVAASIVLYECARQRDMHP
jgi:23S rRNA (guanosine2251-2'-O)-methyltransferase